ncbi:MAG TPA: hypothetical protein VKQ72_07475, partial [Aggregatilineales bacterium]|nr:hypothetical protein [Aggregatilineales bacterium]
MMQATAPKLLPSLHSFMVGLIDYAGLFPPTKQPLSEAINEYAMLRDDPDRWMLSRFIIPAAQLEELSALAGHLFDPTDPFVFSVLGRGGSDAEDFLDCLDADLQAVADFRGRHAQAVVADVFETRLPASVTSTHDAGRIRK